MTRLLSLLLLAVSSAFAQPTVHSISILHSNDLHAHLRPDADGKGGFAYLAAELRHQREGCGGCIYLNAGDLVQGNPVSTIYHGVPVYEISNLLGIDAATIGNHEFDYGWAAVQGFVKTAQYPLVSANVVNNGGAPLAGKGWTILKVDGVRVAVIGEMLGDLVGNLATEEAVGPWHVEPVAESVKKAVAQLKGQADLFVVVGHIHSAEAEQIVHQVPEVSVVVIGHEHTGYKEAHKFGDQYVVEVKSYGAELGRLDLKFDTATERIASAEWKVIPIDSQKIAPAPDVARLVDEWEDKVSKIVDVPVGEAKRRLAGADLRRDIEAAMAEASGADIAWINNGNVRGFLPQGQLLARQIWDILPFDNYIVVGTFKGSELPAPVKREYPNLDPDKVYKMATTDFTAANQASRDQLGVSGMKFPLKSVLQRDAMIDWVKKKKVLD